MEQKRCEICLITKNIYEFDVYENGDKKPLCDYCDDLYYRTELYPRGEARYNYLMRTIHDEDLLPEPDVKYIDYKYERTKHFAKERNKEFTLTEEEFRDIVVRPCEYCGDFHNKLRGIDRVVNTKGYIPGNCVPCCLRCNRAKWTSSKKTFLDWIKDVAYYNDTTYKGE